MNPDDILLKSTESFCQQFNFCVSEICFCSNGIPLNKPSVCCGCPGSSVVWPTVSSGEGGSLAAGIEEEERPSSLLGVTMSGIDAGNWSEGLDLDEVEGDDGAGGGGCVATLEAPVATGGGISASSTARPFLTEVSMDWRVCRGNISRVK